MFSSRLLPTSSRVGPLLNTIIEKEDRRPVSLKEKFSEIYEKNTFGGRLSRSREGSDLLQTQVIRNDLPKIIQRLSIQSLMDAPCGDWYWMKETNLENVQYIGVDIVEAMLEQNQKNFCSPTRSFLCRDLATDPLPKADLILCRDCLVHLEFEDALRIIENFKRSGAEYLLTTTFTKRERNIEDGFWRPLNLRLAPFNFPEPLLTVTEGCTEMSGQYADKSLGLWRLSEISLAPEYMKIDGRNKSIILNAPSVNSKGGVALLRAFLQSSGRCIKWSQIDRRASNLLQLPADVASHLIKPSLFSRLVAEWRLWRKTRANDVVLCFHGVPPLFPLQGQVVVLLQNRILVDARPITTYPFFTRIRLQLERWMLRFLATHADKFVVQTPSMARDARKLLGIHINVVISPYTDTARFDVDIQQKRYDFVYVATDEAHKNHLTLLEAWRLLADAGHTPVLALTVPVNGKLAPKIADFSKRHQLNINNLGEMNSPEISRLYQMSAALIFPSTAESLGLPLIEAAQHGLPILAPEMDYVRDIVTPSETFDPHSPVSIARAVRRFLRAPEPAITLGTPGDFLAEVLK